MCGRIHACQPVSKYRLDTDQSAPCICYKCDLVGVTHASLGVLSQSNVTALRFTDVEFVLEYYFCRL